MSGSDTYTGAVIAQGEWSSDVTYAQGMAGLPGSVIVNSLDAGTASLLGVVANVGDVVTATVTIGGAPFQQQLQAVGDFLGGSLFVDQGGNYYLFAAMPLMAGVPYQLLSGFGLFESGSAPCFAERTCIETESGPVAVEALLPGDRVRLARGGTAPVVWTGRRSIVCARHAPQDVWPVRVSAGAVAPGLPARDLYLSPEHALFIDGALVPVRHLLNDATIVQVPVDRITYWHVELSRHDVLLAEGMPAESYLDTGNRGAFAGPWGLTFRLAAAVPPVVGVAEANAWRSHACAPRLDDPERQAALCRRLRARAAELGFEETDDAALTLRTAGQPLTCRWDGARAETLVPVGARMLTLHSRTSVAAQQVEGSTDRRRLGVAVTQITLDGAVVPLHDGRLLAGWHPPEPNLRWTNGHANLVLPPLRRPVPLVIYTAPMLYYWRPVAAERAALAA